MKPSTHPGKGLSAKRRQFIRRYWQVGFEVTIAGDVLEALALMQQRPGLLVLLERGAAQKGRQFIEQVPSAAEEHQQLTLPLSGSDPMPIECRLL